MKLRCALEPCRTLVTNFELRIQSLDVLRPPNRREGGPGVLLYQVLQTADAKGDTCFEPGHPSLVARKLVDEIRYQDLFLSFLFQRVDPWVSP